MCDCSSIHLQKIFFLKSIAWASRDGLPRTVPQRSCGPSWPEQYPHHLCPWFASMMGRSIIPVRRPRNFWPSMPTASRCIRCRRIRQTTIPWNTCGRRPRKRATHNQYCKEFALLTGSVEKALAYFATHPETVLGLFGRYCEESGLELEQAA